MPRMFCHALLLLLTCPAFTVSGKLMDGIFTETFKSPGYYLVTTIPKGSISINVTDLSYSKNYLALRLSNGTYLFNNNYNISPSGAFEAAGTKFIYTRRHLLQPQSFYARGPVNTSVDVMLIYHRDEPKIFYQYETDDLPISSPPVLLTDFRGLDKFATSQRSQPANIMMGDDIKSSSMKPRRKRKRMYAWTAAAGFSKCSKSCGGGLQSKRNICIRKHKRRPNGEIWQVPNSYCSPLMEPASLTLRCNNNPCPPQWEPGQWSECSVSCGNGTRSRELQCIQEMSGSLRVRVDYRHCSKEPQSAFSLVEACSMPDCRAHTTPMTTSVTTKHYVAPPHWKVEEWSPCSASCGDGTRTRVVTCVTPGSPCDPTEQPAAEELCNMGPCSTKLITENEIPEDLTETSWMYSAWPEACPAECGTGIKTRRLYCDDYVKNKPCDEKNMPIMNKTCTTQTCGQWFVGPWTACSSSCEMGIATREVVCVSRFLGYLKVVDSKNCLSEKPDTTKGCEGPPCNATWFMSDWSRCSRSCGAGTQKRVVKCIGPDGMPINESVSECDEEKRPTSTRNCNEISCNEIRDRDAANPFASLENNNFGKECRDITLYDCRKLRNKSKDSKYKCQMEIFKKACCKACRYNTFINTTG